MRSNCVFAGLMMALAPTALAFAAPAVAQTPGPKPRAVSDPQAAMIAALKVEDVDTLPRTPRLAALERTYEERRKDRDLSDTDLSFEYLTGAQEPAGITNVTNRVSRSGNTMTLITRFRVFSDRDRTLTSRWLRGKDGLWRMDDMTDGKKSLSAWFRTPVTD